MNWINDQIRLRKELDQKILEDSLLEMADAILGKAASHRVIDSRIETRAAMDEILKYYHLKPREVPEDITDGEEQLDYILRPHGLARRNVTLGEGWYRDAYGPMLGFLAESDEPVALIPGTFSGYTYVEPGTGIRRRISRKNASLFQTDAICFYRPLPPKKIGIRDLIVYLKNCIESRDVVMIIAGTLIVTLVGMLAPKLTYALTGPVIKRGNGSVLLGVAIFLICTAVSAELFSVVKTLLLKRVETKSGTAVEAAMMMRILSLPPTFFRQYSAGELAGRSQSVNSLCRSIVSMVLSTGLNSVVSLMYVSQIFHYAPVLTIPALCLVTVSVLFTILVSFMQIRINRMEMEYQVKESGMTYGVLSGIQKIRLAGAEKRVFGRWASIYSGGVRFKYNQPMILRLSGVINTGIGLAGTILLYYLAARNHIASDAYYAFSAAYACVTAAFTSLAGIAGNVASIKPVLDMARPFLEAEPEFNADKAPVSELHGSIELSNIRFRYATNMPYVIDGLNLKIHAGEYVAIVGKTGCGKSTLVRLLLGFETPEFGTVCYDGRDLADLDLKSLRRHIGTVTQNGSVFQGSIYENIAIATPHLTMEQAWEAAATAGLAKDIAAMPMGMYTYLSESGGGISGGQKQRLLIARAVAGKPNILLFDEATSALDNITQKEVSNALDALRCTRIIIAHRLSTIQNCDRILVMDGGKIIESGTYKELVDKKGFFAELVARQQLDDN